MTLKKDDQSFIQRSALSKDKPNDYTRAATLIPMGFKPIGPYGKIFYLYNTKTRGKFPFYMPVKNGEIDEEWLTALKDQYYERFPEQRIRDFNLSSGGLTNPSPAGFAKVQCQRCNYIWNYKGKKRRVSCPNCFTTVTRFKPEKPQATPKQHLVDNADIGPSRTPYPEIIIASDITDLSVDGIVRLLDNGSPFFNGKRLRKVPKGTLIDPQSLIRVESKREEKKTTLDDISKAMDILKKIDELEQQRKHTDVADAFFNGTSEEFTEAVSREIINQYIAKSVNPKSIQS